MFRNDPHLQTSTHYSAGLPLGLRKLLLLLTLLSGLLASGCQWFQKNLQPPPPPSPSAVAPTGPRVYVTDEDSRIIAIRTEDNKVAEQISIELGAGGVAVSPDNLLLYATARQKNYLRIFQTNGTPLGRVSTGQNPAGLDLSRDGKRAYVANKGSNTISILDLTKRKEIKSIPTGQEPVLVVNAPDDKRFYVLTQQDNQVIAYDSKTYGEIARATVGADPHGLAIDPEGKFLYVTSFDMNAVYVLDADYLTEVARVKVADLPYEVVATRDGNIYVGCVEDNSIVTFKRGDWTGEPKATPIGKRPYGLATSKDEKLLYVALEGESRVTVRALPGLEEKTMLDQSALGGMKPIDVFTGR